MILTTDERIEMGGSRKLGWHRQCDRPPWGGQGSVYRWIDEQGLPAHRVGRLFHFKLSKIDEWVRQDNDLSAPPACRRAAADRRALRQAGQENIPNSVQSRPSSKGQTNRSTAKTRSLKRGGNE